MKLLLDINIVLDALLEREPWAVEAGHLLSHIQSGKAKGFVAGHTITTIHYLLRRELGAHRAKAAVSDVLRIVNVVPVGDADFQQALVLEFADFEDAVQAAAALQIGAEFIVTRDRKGYENAGVPARSAGEVIALLRHRKEIPECASASC